MGIRKATLDEAIAYAKERAQRLGTDQVIVEADGGYRVGSEKKMAFFYPDAQVRYVRHQW